MFDINTPPMSKSDIATKTDELKNFKARSKRLTILTSTALLTASVILIQIDEFIFAFGFVVTSAFCFAGIGAVAGAITVAVVGAVACAIAVSLFGIGAIVACFFGTAPFFKTVAFFVAAAISGTAACVLHKISANLESYPNKISSLSPISETDCPKLVEIAQRREEVKAYIKAVSTLDRMPIQGEFEMLCGFDKDYEKIFQDKDSEESARKACEAICAGQI